LALPADRHRRIGLGIGLVILVVGAASSLLHPTRYESSASLVLLSGLQPYQLSLALNEPVAGTDQSPLARSGNAVVAELLDRIYSGSAKRDQLAEQGLDGHYIVSTLTRPRSGGLVPEPVPVFAITAVSSSPDAARQGAELVVADVQQELARLQDGYDPRMSVHASHASEPTVALPTGGSKVRLAGGFGLLAVIVYLATPWVLRSLASGVRRLRAVRG